MNLYWCGWNVPDDVPEEDMLAEWPACMKGWCSGSGEGYDVYVGAVWGMNVEQARLAIRHCYGLSGHRIVERWEPHTIPEDTTSERFPGGMPAKPKEYGT